MNELSINIGMPKQAAKICCEAMGVEIDAVGDEMQRSSVGVACDEGGLNLHITAKDLNALRAALNTYFRWVVMCCDVVR
ncbi:MAG: hypothetical protein A7316_01770 [Candidatus Altiarchaeales archaeon WOR_SM1_86-2]|nr:MAG: hypothetical protein A7315_05200 [Candidatus Altiarchaeales archaeon WOR_SM1_79]ODS37437.1 MAG: hypothetical protein A7316_01770 [Candidatus Altiarchaeales archaeon WOR_SM1_86-2]